MIFLKTRSTLLKTLLIHGRPCFLGFIFFPVVAHASVASDINALLDRFFGGDQAPVEDIDYTPQEAIESLPVTLTSEPAQNTPLENNSPLPETAGMVAVRREIMQQEAELEAFEQSLREQEQSASQVRSQRLTNQQQLQLLDEQIEINRRKLDFYETQVQEWQQLVETLTREKSRLRSQIRVLERDSEALMSKNFIQKQNFQLNPTISWWQWMFSDRSVSELLNERRQTNVEQLSQSQALARLEGLKQAFDKQEKEAVTALVTVSELEQKLLKDQIVLNDLAEAKATLLARLDEEARNTEAQLASLRASQAEKTQYLQNLRQELTRTPTPDIVIENTDSEAPLLAWPLETPVTINAGFKDPQYEINFGREHLGIDLVASQGTDVLAAAEGIVNKVATDSSGYTYIIIQHDPDLYTIYGHLSSTLVEAEEPVTAGQVIAWSGGTPGTPGAGFFTSGPHLHFEVFSGGQFVDPLLLLPE